MPSAVILMSRRIRTNTTVRPIASTRSNAPATSDTGRSATRQSAAPAYPISTAAQATIDMDPAMCNEFLPVVVQDHHGRVATTGHAILNPLHTADLIDMKRSRYRPNSFDPTEIASLAELHVLADRVDPAVHIFRAETMPDQIFIDGAVHDAFEQAGLTGLRLFPAEGWDGNTM